MSESKIQVSFKLPNGTIPLFRGDSTEEVETLITAAVTSETFVGTLEAFAEAVGLSKPAQVVANPTPNVDYAIASLGATAKVHWISVRVSHLKKVHQNGKHSYLIS